MSAQQSIGSPAPEAADWRPATGPGTAPDIAATTSRDAFKFGILDAVSEGVFIIAVPDGRIRDVNQGALALTGEARRSIVGRPFEDVLELPNGRSETGGSHGTRAPIDRLLAPLHAGQVATRTIRMALRRRSAESIPVEVLFHSLEIADGDLALVAIARDVRERMDTQARLQRLAEAEHTRAAELNAVIRAMGDGVVVCARDGRITLSNPAAQDLFEDVIEQTYSDILAQLVVGSDDAPDLGRHAGPQAFRTRREPERWIEISTYPVNAPEMSPDLEGETIVMLRDVTEARQREQIRETFIGVLSHELRTPVTTIFGGAKILSRTGSTLDDATRREIFDDIAAESERLHRLVEDVIALNRFGEDGADIGREPVLLQRLVPMVVESERERWPGVSMHERIPGGLPTVTADATYVEQVVRNLISNAAKYGGVGTSVEVAVEQDGDEVLIRILDDGPGIDAAEAGRLFELFYRAESTAGSTAGAGIGLFVCARLVRALGGRIWASPRSMGGSEFGFSLEVMADD